MGLEVSTEAVANATLGKSYFGFNRHLGVWPTQYPSIKTAVTVDVLEAGLILAFVMLAFCFYIVLPGIRGQERLYCFIRITMSLFLGACVLLCNWGQEWEVDELTTHTHYKAFTNRTIEAHVGIKIGLRNVNITLKGVPEYDAIPGERINYNERFWWSFPWHQGRIGFGPYAAEVSQEFREAQYKGLPYPILWVAEYFTFDGEGIRWGRNYRTAGWYTHIMEWTAFCCWLLANVLYFMNPRLGGYMTMIMGGFLITGNILFSSIRNFNELVIPFESGKLEPVYGWCYWLNLVAGLLSILIGLAVVILDIFIPDWLAAFFGVDILKDYEEFYPETEDAATSDSSTSRNGGNVESPPSSSTNRQSTVAMPQFRKRGFTVKAKRPVAPPRRAPNPDVGGDEEGMELYENAPRLRQVNGSSEASADKVSLHEE
ncbi:dual oxidase maturation factor 2-like [Watersipora subatra]|uniref:dual oxidase maturation factor 2-like n=1 Tax=Watersipora subatra TaxID=2589382 RepID=UPI00355C2201